MKLVLGRGYAVLKSLAVPTGVCISRGEKAFWVHIMGPDFEPRNGIFALYRESGNYSGGCAEKLPDIDPNVSFDPKAEQELSLEEELEISDSKKFQKMADDQHKAHEKEMKDLEEELSTEEELIL